MTARVFDVGEYMARGLERLRQTVEVAYDGLLNHHAHTQEERDEITNKVGEALDPETRKRIAGA